MFITITIDVGGKRIDIKIDDRQTIVGTMNIIKNSRKFSGDIPCFYRSLIKETVVSGYHTFKESEINTGDILTAL